MVSTKYVLVGFLILFVSACTNNTAVKKLEKSYIVTGHLDRYWIDGPNTYICYYNVVDSNDLYSFSAIPPKGLGKCTKKATINLINEEVVWVVEDVKYLSKR